MSTFIIKEDGREQLFDAKKLETGLMKAAVEAESGIDAVSDIVDEIVDLLESNGIDKIKSKELSSLVKTTILKEGEVKLAERFITFSAEKQRTREMNSELMKEYEEITFSSEADSEIKRENANISSVTAMGTMLKYGSEGAKKFSLLYLLSQRVAEAHKEGWIHIHDLDFLSTGTETCCHIPIDKLFSNGGFNTGHGAVREPGNIRTAASLAAICIQANQNDQHGGQAIPLFDWYLAPYVALTYVKTLAKYIKIRFDIKKEDYLALRKTLIDYRNSCNRKLVMNEESYKEMKELIVDFLDTVFNLGYEDHCDLPAAQLAEIDRIFDEVYEDVDNEVYQAMEGFIHNMNTLHSRAGSQVPFSSINFGTDISTEGRMIVRNELLATKAGMGNGETAIFPISIFKEKAGVNYNPEDPNYDLWKLSCEVSALRLYPNFVNLDAQYNAKLYVEGHPETEMATMGCVEEAETVDYKIDGTRYIETFKEAFLRISKLAKIKTQGNSEYIDLENLDVTVRDTLSGNGAYTKVKKIIKNSNVTDMRTIKFTNGRSLTATSYHPLPVVGKGRTFVRDIVAGDKIPVAEEDIDSDGVFSTEYFGSDTDAAYLLGLILADGCYSSSQICISLGYDELDIIEKLSRITAKLGYRLDIKEQNRGEKGNYFDCCIREIGNLKAARYELSELFGAFNKCDRYITSELMLASKEIRIALLAGLIDADGYVTTSNNTDGTSRSARFSLGSTNKKLALTELKLIRGLGIKANLIRNKYTSRNNKIRFLIEFEIKADIISNMASNKKINVAKKIDKCIYKDVKEIEVIEVLDKIADNENGTESYDFETYSDTFDVSGLCSHNCRTRVGDNIAHPENTVIPGRGNLSFTSINLPRLAIESQGNKKKFFKLLDKYMDLVHDELLERFEIQCSKHPINFPFLMGQGTWVDSDKLGPNDDMRDVLKNGTLAVGFIGLAETLIYLTGKHHGESEKSQELGLKIIKHMRDMTDKWSIEEKMNYGVLATPAEGLSGRFVRMDKKRYGTIKGVTDKEYYTNSFHVPVYYNISAYKKIDIEAPYHNLCNGGHITYIELDGNPTDNIEAFEKVVRYMHDKGIGYGAINHPLDRDSVCGYVGVIPEGGVCPRCGRKEFEPMTVEMWNKLKRYAGAGNVSTCGACGNPDEEADRVTNKA